MKNLGNPEVTTELKQTIIEGVLQEAGNRSVEQLVRKKTRRYLDFLICARKPTAEVRFCIRNLERKQNENPKMANLTHALEDQSIFYSSIGSHNCLAVCDAAIFTGSHTGEAGGT